MKKDIQYMFNTLKYAKQLESAGFTLEQCKALTYANLELLNDFLEYLRYLEKDKILDEVYKKKWFKGLISTF